jgi:hypothetical protein
VIVLFFLLTFFFIGGCVIGCLKRSIRGIILGAFYFLSVVLIPFLADIGNEINAANMDSLLKFDLHNLKIIMKKEKELIDKYGSLKSTDPVPADLVNELKEAVKNEHGKIKKRESQMRKHMLKKIKQSQTAAAFFPVLNYISTYKEISSQGDLNFVDFYSYGQQRKGEFIDFYIKKRFPEGKEINPDKVGPVENFVKSNENLFFAKTRLPSSFILGVCLTFFYIIVLLIILYLIFRPHRKAIVKPSIDFEKGNSLFVFCENEKIKNDIFHSYQAQRNASCLDRLTDLSFSGIGIRTKLFLRLFCRLSGVNEKEVLEKLRTMRIADIDTLKVSPEIILKIYAAVMMSKKDLQYLILNDFFKQMTREFERDVTVLLNALLKDGMIVIYLSCDYFNMLESLDEKVSLKGHATIKLPLGKVTLR